MEAAERTLVAWCPDWSVRAAGCDPSVPAAVVAANRVVSTTPAARAEGVLSGLRRREAQARCPELEVVAADPARDARSFEAVAAAVEAFTPGVEIVRPGVVALATRGPSRYFGGDAALAERVAAAVDAVADPGGGSRCRVGVADGRLAAGWAARAAARGAATPVAPAAAPAASGPAATPVVPAAVPAASGPAATPVAPAAAPAASGPAATLVVPAGGSPAFLAPLPISALPDRDLAGVLLRLAITTLGDLASLPAATVLERFGPAGAAAHRLARGLDEHPLSARVPPPDLTVTAELDPPAERVDTAAFVVRSLAAELHDRLSRRGLACTRVVVEAETEHGERLSRRWRHEGTLGAGALAERARWQLEGWIEGGRVTGGLTMLQLVPDEVAPDDGRQLGFWGGAAGDDGVIRSLARVQGLLGPDGVLVAVPAGGRGPGEQLRLVPWGDEPGAAPPTATSTTAGPGAASRPGGGAAGGGPPPWPGRLPGPAPALVPPAPLPAAVEDAGGVEVTVGGRGVASGAPARVAVAGGPWQPVAVWTGPWPLEERWWEGERRRARLQVVTGDGRAYLLTREAGRWWAEAVYD